MYERKRESEFVSMSCKLSSALIITIISIMIICCLGCDKSSHNEGNLNNTVVQIADDGIFTMSPTGSQPVFRYVGNYDRTYIGYYNSHNEIQIKSYDAESDKFSMPVTLWSDWGKSSGGVLGDDHANPSIIVLSNQRNNNENGKILVAAAEHGYRLQTRKSMGAEDISTWEKPVPLLDNKATYARLIELNDGKVWLIVRLSHGTSNSRATFFLFTSDDGGDNWSGPELIADTDDVKDSSAVYLTTTYDGLRNRIHFMFNLAVYDEPVQGVARYKNIYYANYDHIQGKWSSASGSIISSGLPLIISNSDLVYESNNDVPVAWTYLSDIKIDKDGHAYLLSINDPGRGDLSINTDNIDEEILRHNWTNEGWKTERVGRSARFSSYTNMATFENGNTDTVYGFPPNEKGYGELARFTRLGNGGWQEEQITVGTFGKHHARPFTVIDGGSNYPPSKLKLLWCLIDGNYGESPYTDWTSSIQALIEK